MSQVAPESRSNLPSPGRRAEFPRAARLLRHSDFERVYKQGRRHFAAHMTVFYRRRTAGGSLRIGFTVGKALGGAVERNRLKRRLREVVRLHWPETPLSVDVVINPKKSLAMSDFSELGSEISRAWEVIQKFVEKGTT